MIDIIINHKKYFYFDIFSMIVLKNNITKAIFRNIFLDCLRQFYSKGVSNVYWIDFLKKYMDIIFTIWKLESIADKKKKNYYKTEKNGPMIRRKPTKNLDKLKHIIHQLHTEYFLNISFHLKVFRSKAVLPVSISSPDRTFFIL